MAAGLVWGTHGGTDVMLYTLQHGCLRACVTTYGATLVSLHAPDRDGQEGNVVAGFDSLEAYLSNGHPYMGVTVGRVANRIANARFTLDGKHYSLAANNGAHCLHGGVRGFDKRVWTVDSAGPACLTLSLVSPDGEEGFPGELRACVTFSLDAVGLAVVFRASAHGAATPVSLTNHAYFNLACFASATVADHVLRIDADRYVPVDESLAPLGVLAPVRETAFDFTSEVRLGERLGEFACGGLDHCFVLSDAPCRPLARALTLTDPQSGRVMHVATTQPSVQVYSGNFLDGSLVGAQGVPYVRHGALCFETQAVNDAVNQAAFPSCILRPGDWYEHTTRFDFALDK